MGSLASPPEAAHPEVVVPKYVSLPNAPKTNANSKVPLQRPTVGLGTWRADANKTREAVIAAIEAGYRLIDTANDYGNENEVGEGIKFCIEQ
eukprot:gene9-8_t